MLTNVKQTEPTEQTRQPTRWYDIPYPASAYTFPDEALLHCVKFDNDYIHLELTDGRVVSVPLWWIPTLHNAEPEEREKYEISRDRKMIVWDPDKCSINDELRIDDYLVPRGGGSIVPSLTVPLEPAAVSAWGESTGKRKQGTRLSRLSRRPNKRSQPTPQTTRRA